MFSHSSGDAHQPSMNLLERQTLKNVRKILNSRELLSKEIPTLPAMLIQLLDALKNEDTEIEDFVQIIEQDPAFAAQVLKIVNSPQYQRAEGETRSLYRAICILGLKGVSSIASRILMSKVVPSKPIYYKMFGRQIWSHSVQCASLCMALASPQNQDEFDAYFLGLIHDLGKIIIFNCLCEALTTVLIDSLPGTEVFKELMSEMSTDITYHIAQEWQLPQIYCQALQEQSVDNKSELGNILYQANQLCENYLLFERGLINQEQVDNVLSELTVKPELWQELIEIAPLIDSSI